MSNFFKYKISEEEKNLIDIAKKTQKTYEESAKTFANVACRKGLHKINESRAKLLSGLIDIIEKATR